MPEGHKTVIDIAEERARGILEPEDFEYVQNIIGDRVKGEEDFGTDQDIASMLDSASDFVEVAGTFDFFEWKDQLGLITPEDVEGQKPSFSESVLGEMEMAPMREGARGIMRPIAKSIGEPRTTISLDSYGREPSRELSETLLGKMKRAPMRGHGSPPSYGVDEGLLEKTRALYSELDDGKFNDLVQSLIPEDSWTDMDYTNAIQQLYDKRSRIEALETAPRPRNR